MAEFQHDRAPDQTATQTLAIGASRIRAASAVVSVRLWRNREDDSPGELFSGNLGSAACLAIDMLVASRGEVVQTRGKTLHVAFSDVSTAILAARRLQWAFQGLSEADQFAGTPVAILVQSRQDLPDQPTDDSFCVPLEQAAPGQILLAEKASQFLNDLPGLATESIPDSALRELVWRRPDGQSSMAADEQTLFRNIKGQSNADPVFFTEQLPDAWDNSPAASDAISSEPGQPDGPSPQSTAGGLWAGLRNKRWIVWSGSAAALICAVTFTVIALHRQSPVPSQPQSPVTAPTAPSPSGSLPQEPVTAPPKATVESVTPAEKPAAPKLPKPQPAKPHDQAAKENQPSSSCELSAADAKNTLARAENRLHNGKYGDAKRDFQSILGCESTSAEAREGLQQVRARQEAAR
jgi:hypothetical protein